MRLDPHFNPQSRARPQIISLVCKYFFVFFNWVRCIRQAPGRDRGEGAAELLRFLNMGSRIQKGPYLRSGTLALERWRQSLWRGLVARACLIKIAIGDSDLINVRFGSLCGRKSDIARSPRSAQVLSEQVLLLLRPRATVPPSQ